MMKTLPKFLKEYELDLKRYERECIKINTQVKNFKPLEDRLDLKQSKFLGLPFFPKSKKYPVDKNNKEMIMVAQINFEEIPTLAPFPKDGILQLFLSVSDWYEDDVKIIYHSKDELKNDFISNFSFLNESNYEEMPVFKVHKILFEKSIDKGGSEDSQFDYLFDDKNYWDFTEVLSEDEEEEFGNYFNASGHKIGGYGEFTQYDPREYKERNFDDIQLLQIDTDNHIMFGDCGIAHIFIDEESLIKKDFSKAYFYWDCC